ncbi:MAG: hypothetical protein GY953_32535 [bacterium]|nr:hypothetical protein [bacterium]
MLYSTNSEYDPEHSMPAERVTVTFPPELLRGIDRQERNRSRFIQEAAGRVNRRVRLPRPMEVAARQRRTDLTEVRRESESSLGYLD